MKTAPVKNSTFFVVVKWSRPTYKQMRTFSYAFKSLDVDVIKIHKYVLKNSTIILYDIIHRLSEIWEAFFLARI